MTSFCALSDFLDNWLKRRSQTAGIPGFVVSIAKGGDLFFSQAYGLSSLEVKSPLTTEHIFPGGSQSKMITATAIMLLIEQGLLRADRPVASIVPWTRDHPDPAFRHVTVEQLLWHGGGLIRDGLNADYWQLARPFPTKKELQAMLLSAPLAATACKKMKYSNIGYALLGQVIEAVTRQSYAQFCHKEIWQPIGVPAALLDTPHPQLAPGHTRTLGATANDMNRFMIAHFIHNTFPLGHSARHRLHHGVRSHWVPKGARGTRYGLGFQAYCFDGHTVFGHSGSSIGHRSASFFFPDMRLTLSIMTNARDAPVLQMGRGIGEVCRQFFANQHTVPWSHKKFTAYLAGSNGTMYITPIGKRLVTLFPDDWLPFLGAEELCYVDPSTLLVKRAHDLAAEGELVRFTFGAHGVQAVNYTGATLLPEQQYNTWLKANLTAWQASASEELLA